MPGMFWEEKWEKTLKSCCQNVPVEFLMYSWPWFMTRGNLAPSEDLSKFEDIFGCHNLGQRCYWHLVGRDQGSCWRSYSMHDNLHNKELFRDFPGGPVVKNSLCNAGEEGLIPGWRTKILHAAEQLSPWAATTELTQHNKRSHMTQLRPHPAE